MPKERFHLLIADEFLRSRQKSGNLPGALGKETLSYFLGAISPDIFFYDVPTFKLGALGDRMHELMELRSITPIHEWLSGDAGAAQEAAFAWGMGFASHFLADALWHPIINDLGGSLVDCQKRGISPIGCHRLIESEMEAFWLARMGDPGGYVGLLKKFASDRKWLGEISSIYRGFLAHTGLGPLPSEGGIRKCFLSQNFLLRIFSNPTLGRHRDRLLNARIGRYLGTLVAPARPFLASGSLSRVPADRNPFSGEFMKEGLTSLVSRLSDFAERLLQFPPS